MRAGPFPVELPLPSEHWQGELATPGGRVTGWEPCWIDWGQTPATIEGDRAGFALHTGQYAGTYMADLVFNANVFEIEAAPEGMALLYLNGKCLESTLADLSAPAAYCGTTTKRSGMWRR